MLGRAGDERGSITAELALALPAVVLVLALVLTVGSAAAQQQRCADAARTAARLAAAGESDAVVADAVRRLAGRAARVEIGEDGSWVVVEVSTGGPQAWFVDGAVAVSATAVGWREAP